MSKRSLVTILLASVFVFGSFFPAYANVNTRGSFSAPMNIRFGVPVPYPVEAGHGFVAPLGTIVHDTCDDCSEEVIINDTIEGGLKFGDTTYNSIFVGTNGYITFGHSQTSFDPEGIPGYTVGPMIAGQYDDLDPGNGGNVYIYEDDANDRVTVTWHQVAPYETPTDGSGVNTFQIRLHGLWDGVGDGAGDFGIEIRYDTINWTRGMPADPGDYPTGGWTVGDGVTYGEVTDSGTANFITIEDETNIDHPGVFAWGVYNGGVEEIDESIPENSPAGTEVAPLTADDDGPYSELTFILLDDDGGNFEIYLDSGVYKVRVAAGATLDYETSPGHLRQIQVQVTDQELPPSTSSAWLDIPLTDVNEMPIITEGSSILVTMSEDGSPTPFDLTLHASDEDTSDTLTWSISSAASNGSASASGTGTSKVTGYTPTANYNGSDSFNVQVDDGNGGTDEITVNVTIEPVQDPPDAVDDAVSTDEDTAFTTIDLVADNDTDPDVGDTLSVTGIDTTGTIGQVTDNGNGTFDYDPNGQFESLGAGDSTTDTFTYTISDGNGGSDSATVTVTINGVNDGPTAVDDAVTTDEDTAFTTIDLVADNDTDPDPGDTLSVTGINTTGTIGQVTDNGNGTFDYDPNGQFESLAVGDITTDTFAYTISDGNGGSDSATVTATINGVNDDPNAYNDSDSTLEDTPVTVDVLFNDDDIDAGDSLIVSAVTNGSNGSVTNNGSDVTYDPDPNYFGTDTFTYTVEDSQGATDTATVTITVSETEDMVVLGNSLVIANGDATPSSADDTDFGSTALFLGTVEHTFTIENRGNIDLSLTGIPRVSIGGVHPADFSITTQPGTPIASGGTTTFSVEFDPIVAGTRMAIISIEYDDNTAPYTFTVQGTAATQDSDNDGIEDNVEGGGDRDNDGVPNYQDYDPTGYFYDQADGEIISGGSVSVSGPGAVTIVQNGSGGYYQFVTDGTAGTYTMAVTIPPGYTESSACLQGDPPPFDPTGLAEPVVLGNGENADTGFLTSNACTTFYLTFDLAGGDPIIINNNIPLRARALPETGFTPGILTELAEQTAEKSYQNLRGLWLDVPSIGVRVPIVGIPAANGEWDVTWLGNQAGYLIGTAFPTWAGNTVITGHVWNQDNQPGIFVDLKTLRYGDQIQIHAWGEIYTYQVQTNRLISPHVPKSVLDHKDGDWVTLFTCEEYGQSWGDYGYRRMVQAVLVSVRGVE